MPRRVNSTKLRVMVAGRRNQVTVNILRVLVGQPKLFLNGYHKATEDDWVLLNGTVQVIKYRDKKYQMVPGLPKIDLSGNCGPLLFKILTLQVI